MIDPTGQKAINDLWKPNSAGDDASGVNNFKTAYAWWLKYWNISDRVDYNASDRIRLYYCFPIPDPPDNLTGAAPGRCVRTTAA
jgi:hypothetical protein